MAVDAHWRLYYNDAWVATHTVEENAALLIHEVSHLLRDHEARKKAAASGTTGCWNTAGDCEINDDLHAEGLPLPGDPPLPGKYGLQTGDTAETYYKPAADSRHERTDSTAADEAQQPWHDCGSGAHGERRLWELPADDGHDGGVPGVDRSRPSSCGARSRSASTRCRRYAGDVPLGWRRWAHATLTPKVDYMATIRHAVRRALRDSTLGRYDRTYRRPHRRQACYGEFIMAELLPAAAEAGFLIDTSSSMEDTQLARAVASSAD